MSKSMSNKVWRTNVVYAKYLFINSTSVSHFWLFQWISIETCRLRIEHSPDWGITITHKVKENFYSEIFPLESLILISNSYERLKMLRANQFRPRPLKQWGPTFEEILNYARLAGDDLLSESVKAVWRNFIGLSLIEIAWMDIEWSSWLYWPLLSISEFDGSKSLDSHALQTGEIPFDTEISFYIFWGKALFQESSSNNQFSLNKISIV